MPRAPPVMMTTRFSKSPMTSSPVSGGDCAPPGGRCDNSVGAVEAVWVVLGLDPGRAVVPLLTAIGVDEAVGLVEVEHVGVYAHRPIHLEPRWLTTELLRSLTVCR